MARPFNSCFFLLLLLLCMKGFAFTPVDERFINVPSARLFCRTQGHGKPLIVLHGGPGLSQDYLLPYMSDLFKDHFVIFYDQRGCGRSTGELITSGICLQTYIEDLDFVKSAFGFEKVSILGHSWGGFLAMNYAMEHPESIEKLVLMNPTPSNQEDYKAFVQEYLDRTAPFNDELNALQSAPEFSEGDPTTIAHYYRIIFRTYCYNPEDANKLDLTLSQKAASHLLKVNALFQEHLFMLPFDLCEGLKNLRCPTLILHGDYDPVPLATAEHTHRLISGSKLFVLKECGHFPYIEKSDITFNILHDFFQNE